MGLRRRFCGRALKAISNRLEQACHQREDALDRFLESLDRSTANGTEQLRDGLQKLEHHRGRGPGARSAPVVSTMSAGRPAGEGRCLIPCNDSVALNAEAWKKARQAAFSRSEDGQVDCPICFQACPLVGRASTRIELLSCSHVFHRCCFTSFESFHVFEIRICPVCRQNYERRPWTEERKAVVRKSEVRPPRARFQT